MGFEYTIMPCTAGLLIFGLSPSEMISFERLVSETSHFQIKENGENTVKSDQIKRKFCLC